ncbi:MAG: class I SAM-dependent methyltransferase [Acidobacteriia bacterium]|nr:class I SAM-dependent methyltransferase [Terriglobia bacterium]
MGPTSGGEAPNPGRIFEVLMGFRESAALKSAIELGVFSAIAEGTSTAGEIGAKCGAAERGIRILCDTLVTMDFLHKDGAAYSNSMNAGIFLDKKSPAYMGGIAGFLFAPDMVQSTLSTMTDCVRKGGTVMPGEGTVDPDNPLWVAFAEAMGPMMMPASMAIAAQVPASGPLTVLDIAAGHGLFGIQIAKRNPEAQIVALDWKAVLEVAQRHAAEAGVGDRYSTLAGSAFDVDFGEGYDVVLVTNFLHHFNAATNTELLRKVHAALRPGGVAITLEFVPDASRVTPVMPARFALTMLTGTQEGDAYTFAELEKMASDAGFSHSVQHLIETKQSVIISTK